jgi:CIC family chloride channel protein
MVLGEGYEYIDMAMNLKFTLGMFFLLVIMKIFATAWTLGTGGSGGVFAPSLVIGSMLGGGIFLLSSTMFPGIVGSPETYIAVGIATILGSAFKAPITAIIMVMEISNNYNIVLPVMIGAVCSTFMGWGILKGRSIYNIKLIQQGIREVETDFWVPRNTSSKSREKAIQKNLSL